jgi:hypothetical protein
VIKPTAIRAPEAQLFEYERGDGQRDEECAECYGASHREVA